MQANLTRNKIILFTASILFVGFAGFVQAQDFFKLPDPTRPYQWVDPSVVVEESDAADTPAHELTLDSILYAPNRRFTIINGQMMREGDVIGKIKVIRIKPHSVIIKKNGVEMTLTDQPSAEDQGMSIIRR